MFKHARLLHLVYKKNATSFVSKSFVHNNTAGHKIFAFGNGFFNQLGTGQPVPFIPDPIPVSLKNALRPLEKADKFTPVKISFISCGFSHNFVGTEKHGVYTWGDNSSMQMGIDRVKHVPEPVPAPFWNVLKLKQAFARRGHSLFQTYDHQLFTAGFGELGQLGTGVHFMEDKDPELNKKKYGYLPNRVDSLFGHDIADVSCGLDHSLVLTTKGQVFGWGLNIDGQLGLGDETVQQRDPKLLQDLEGKDIVKVCAGYDSSSFITAQGKVYVTGNCDAGQLGVNKSSCSIEHIQLVEALTDQKIIDVIHGGSCTYFITENKEIFVSGGNQVGELGLGFGNIETIVPIKLESSLLQGKGIKKITAGRSHVFVLTETNELIGWGGNEYGQLGLGNTETSFIPEKIPFFENKKVLDVSCGVATTLVVVDE